MESRRGGLGPNAGGDAKTAQSGRSVGGNPGRNNGPAGQNARGTLKLPQHQLRARDIVGPSAQAGVGSHRQAPSGADRPRGNIGRPFDGNVSNARANRDNATRSPRVADQRGNGSPRDNITRQRGQTPHIVPGPNQPGNVRNVPNVQSRQPQVRGPSQVAVSRRVSTTVRRSIRPNARREMSPHGFVPRSSPAIAEATRPLSAAAAEVLRQPAALEVDDPAKAPVFMAEEDGSAEADFAAEEEADFAAVVAVVAVVVVVDTMAAEEVITEAGTDDITTCFPACEIGVLC